MKRINALIVLSLLTIALASGCGGEPSPTESSAEAPVLRIGLLPILDAMPFFIAQENGYFTDEGIQVEAVNVNSALERDQMMQAGEIDGQINDLIATASFNRDETRIRVVATAFHATAESPQFRILAAPGSRIASPEDLAGVPIGGSENTIIEYVVERMLGQAGLLPDEIVLESVPAIPTRYEMLMSGDLQAAALPDPLAQAAIEAGAILVLDDTDYPQYSQSVISFRVDVLEEQPDAVRAFLRAWGRAVEELNSGTEAYRDLFVANVRVPESVRGTYTIPTFPLNRAPTEDEWADVVEWMLSKGLLDSALPYADSVTTDFLPD